MERTYILENIDLVSFYGAHNSYLQLLESLFPKLHIATRGNTIKVNGEENEMDHFITKIRDLEAYCNQFNSLNANAIVDIVKGDQATIQRLSDVIIHGVGGRPIIAKSENQQTFVKQFEENDLVFAVGPAGSGKTFLAIALAVKALKSGTVRRIVLSRPAVEAGEKLGFLPGEMKDKLDPYLQPLYDALQEMVPPGKLKDYMDNGTIQIAPLAYMRGRTMNDAVIILDEAQNTTTQQIKMFLTRLGNRSKMIVNGDITQIDLPPTMTSGLVHAISVLDKVQGIGKVRFTKKDIVRHALVQRIVEAYDKVDKKVAAAKNYNTQRRKYDEILDESPSN